MDKHKRLTTEQLPALTDACRRDLGFDAPEPT
jgi:hypothetical protein